MAVGPRPEEAGVGEAGANGPVEVTRPLVPKKVQRQERSSVEKRSRKQLEEREREHAQGW